MGLLAAVEVAVGLFAEDAEVLQARERVPAGRHGAVSTVGLLKSSWLICGLAASTIGEEAQPPPSRPSSRLLIRSRRPSSTIIGEKIIEGTFPSASSLAEIDEGVARTPQSFSRITPRSSRKVPGQAVFQISVRAIPRASGSMLRIGRSSRIHVGRSEAGSRPGAGLQAPWRWVDFPSATARR